jgi:cation transport protein ChaC
MRRAGEDDGDLWVFGYGSLLWNPGFSFRELQPAGIFGYHRALCVYSHVHRGTPEQPGLVLGLDRGGACRGLAYRVASAEKASTIAYLRAREQVTSVYVERRLIANLEDGRRVEALTYVVDRRHAQYSGRLSIAAMIELVAIGTGRSGRNVDYVVSSHARLMELGVRDPTLDAVVAAFADARLAAR